MTVRLSGFQLLSADLPATIRDVDAEIAAAFNADGVVGVSTAPAPAPGAAPAYALGGTIQRDGDTIRVITRLINERSGATLWTDTFNYDGNEVSKVPRHSPLTPAMSSLRPVRGLHLSEAAARRRPQGLHAILPGPLGPQYVGGPQSARFPPNALLRPFPDFSWGWAAVAGAYWKVAMSADEPARRRGACEWASKPPTARCHRQPEQRGPVHQGRADRSDDWIGREAC